MKKNNFFKNNKEFFIAIAIEVARVIIKHVEKRIERR